MACVQVRIMIILLDTVTLFLQEQYLHLILCNCYFCASHYHPDVTQFMMNAKYSSLKQAKECGSRGYLNKNHVSSM